MADNKHALTRYHVLDKCFSNPVKKYFLEDLVNACNECLKEIYPSSKGIQRRQLFDDIKFMESEEGYRAPINKIKEGKKTYYRYSDKKYSIDSQPMNQAEIEKLRSAMNILSRFKGMPQFEWVNELSPKLEQAFMIEKERSPVISFDNNSYLKGIEHLGPLFHHILYKHPLCISYHSFKSDKPVDFIIHPYYLKQYNNRWFLLGLNEPLEKLSTLALDRIVGIKEEAITYRPNGQYDFNEYFEDIIGITLPEDGKLEVIVLDFCSTAAPYILSKPLHGSQKTISKGENGAVVSIEVIPNYELESLILSFRERVKVLEPEVFQKNIAKRLKEAQSIYDVV